MRKFRTAVALTASLAFAGCQTLDGVTVNGVELNGEDARIKQAQGVANTGICAGYEVLCVGGVIGAIILAILLLGDDDDENGDGGGDY
jgi:hypothetical protein